MTIPDQRTIQQAALRAQACLTDLIAAETTGSSRWTLLVEALEVVEVIEAVADEARDGFSPSFHVYQPSPLMRPQRLAFAHSILGEAPACSQVA